MSTSQSINVLVKYCQCKEIRNSNKNSINMLPALTHINEHLGDEGHVGSRNQLTFFKKPNIILADTIKTSCIISRQQCFAKLADNYKRYTHNLVPYVLPLHIFTLIFNKTATISIIYSATALSLFKNLQWILFGHNCPTCNRMVHNYQCLLEHAQIFLLIHCHSQFSLNRHPYSS